MFLTYEDFTDLSSVELDEDKFNKYIDKAEEVVSYVTQHFYQKHDFESDNAWRKKQYQKAIVNQLNYFAEKGADTSSSLSSPTQFSIGRTSVSTGNNRQINDIDPFDNLVNPDIYVYLEGTGLLYRGMQ